MENVKRNIPFASPDLTQAEIDEVVKVLEERWINTGPRTKLLEKKIADWLGSDGCVCLNSQTACAETALRILGVGEGDEVITCAYTYTATASVIYHVGAKIVLIDTQKDGLEMDYDALEAAITEKTKVIIPIDIAGIPCNYERIFDIVERKKSLFQPKNEMQAAYGRIIVMADAAHAFGAEQNGKMVGSIADFSNFSFHTVKNFTTAEGGAMVWRHINGIEDEAIYKKAQLVSLHGQSKDALSKLQPGAWEYDIVAPYYKCNMTDITAAIGLAQFARYPKMLKRRREMIMRYDAAFQSLGIQTLRHYTDKHSSSGHLYIVRVPKITEKQRCEIIAKMANLGVACNVHYKPLPLLTAYKNLGFDIKDYPNANSFYENEITLPLHTMLSDEDVEYVIDCFKKVLSEYL